MEEIDMFTGFVIVAFIVLVEGACITAGILKS